MNILQEFYINKLFLNNWLKIAFFSVISVILSLLSLGTGSANISISEIFTAFFDSEILSKQTQIIMFVRLPRTLSAILTGSALAVSGTILQAVLNNSIVSPNIIGVNAGSGLFSLIAMVFFPALFFLTPVFAFAGALLASFLVLFIGYKTGGSKLTVILSGVAVTSMLSAFSDTIITLFPDAQISRTAFLIGGLSSVTMQNVKFTFIYILLGIALAIIFSYDLNILTLGDQTSLSLGLNVNKIRFIYIAIAALLSASAVSIGGLIGFIGLIIPHIARFIIGYDNRFLIPLSAVLGASFLLICDMTARSLFAPFEIPVGIILSFLGAPFFIFLLLIKKRGKQDD